MKEGEGTGMCDMRGMLSFTILWLLSQRPMYGQELPVASAVRLSSAQNIPQKSSPVAEVELVVVLV